MEVHHHGHHSGKKTWKSYFWEFLMLFLAVFCGFLAEYQLEHMIERDREKSYISSYIEDLKTDTASISRVLKFREQKLGRMDSLMYPPLRSYDRQLQLDLAYCIHNLKGSHFIVQLRLRQLYAKATELIKLLERK